MIRAGCQVNSRAVSRSLKIAIFHEHVIANLAIRAVHHPQAGSHVHCGHVVSEHNAGPVAHEICDKAIAIQTGWIDLIGRQVSLHDIPGLVRMDVDRATTRKLHRLGIEAAELSDVAQDLTILAIVKQRDVRSTTEPNVILLDDYVAPPSRIKMPL